MTNRIEKTIDIDAPVDRVWKALTDHEEFGQWFRVKLDQPFAAGKPSTGHMTWPGYEHIRWSAQVVTVEKPKVFAFTWHPYAIDPNVDYSKETPTLVEFRLEPAGQGTKLVVTETGFDKIPPHRQPDALRMNDSGWATQVKNIKSHVEHASERA
jgi:uncharacterized protein YndB with AHSA1/START domain